MGDSLLDKGYKSTIVILKKTQSRLHLHEYIPAFSCTLSTKGHRPQLKTNIVFSEQMMKNGRRVAKF